jgi:molecular chaperone Hsp33
MMAKGGAETEPEPPAGDDSVLPFTLVRSGAIGQIVRLGALADAILGHHDDPEPVAATLGEALALTAMLGSALKHEGKLILQTRTDGPLRFLVVNHEQRPAKGGQTSGAEGGQPSGGRLRGYVSFTGGKELAKGAAARASLIGSGHLAMTIDPGPERQRYQGIVALQAGSLTEAARTYFRQSEQVPTFLRLAAARVYMRGAWHWRVGGLMVQHLHTVNTASAGLPQGDDPAAEHFAGESDERWRTVRALAETVEDHELLDPTLTPARLLYRLFHEEGVRVQPARPLEEYCQCSHERVAALLASFGAAELADMREEDGAVTVTCEFCRTSYRFEAEDFG